MPPHRKKTSAKEAPTQVGARSGARNGVLVISAQLGGVQLKTQVQPPVKRLPRARRRPAHTSEVAKALLHPLLPDDVEYSLDISIVMGTYNRLELLKRCVASVRQACERYKYEIVISDGGSTDGTVAWLSSQNDVVLLPGDLSGAVNAFNAAARVAKGRYILCLNDDGELEPGAVENALAYFADPLVGQVAMSFLEGVKWKLLTTHGKIYGNFPVTRANIIRAVEKIVGGMWATCYYTYGGDNELSCWVYRLGYKVVGARDARLRHAKHDDSLRSKNIKTDTARRQFKKRWPSANYMRFRGPTPILEAHECAELARIEAGGKLA